MKKQKVVDLRTIKRHPLYLVFNEYFTELFETFPNKGNKIIETPEEMKADLEARYNKTFQLDQVTSALEAYGDELPLGGYEINRADFYLPKNN